MFYTNKNIYVKTHFFYDYYNTFKIFTNTLKTKNNIITNVSIDDISLDDNITINKIKAHINDLDRIWLKKFRLTE